MEYDPTRKAVAEFLGTFTLVFAVSMSIAVGGQVAGIFGAAIAQGLALGIMVSALGHISGAHFNPAVTLGVLVTRRIEPALAVIYWLAQFASAVAAALLVKALLPSALDKALGAPSLGLGATAWQGVLIEGGPHVLPRLGRVRDCRRSARELHGDRRARNRPDRHRRHPARGRAHRAPR